MTDTQLILFATSTLLLLALPGPTNALLAASGAVRGLRQSLPLVGAEIAGYGLTIGGLLLLDEVALGLRSEIGLVLRSAAAVLLIVTAIRMWRKAAAAAARDGAPDGVDAPGAGQVLLLTLLNPKALILGFGLFPPLAAEGRLATATLVFLGAVVMTGAGWIAAGAATRRLPGRPGVAVARLSSLVIAGFACYFAATAISQLLPLSGS